MGISPINVDVPEAGSYVSDNSTNYEAKTTVEVTPIESVNLDKEVEKVETVDLTETPKTEEVKIEESVVEDSSSIEMPDIKEIINKSSKEVEAKYSEEKTPSIEEHKFVNYYQTDYDNPYSQGTIATSGCGPTSAAMALTYLTGKEITPVETAKFGNGTYTCSQGTYWSYFEAVSKKYDVKCEQHDCSSDNIKNGFKNGKPVIISMGPGHFTSAGHFIVLRGMDKDGKVIVADPNSEDRSKQTWDMDTIVSEGKQIWTFPD